MYRILHAFFVPGTKAPGCHHVGTQRKPDEQVDQQIDQRTVGANSGQRRAARKAPHHHNIGGVNSNCRTLDAASGTENKMIFCSMGPLVRSAERLVVAMSYLPPIINLN